MPLVFFTLSRVLRPTRLATLDPYFPCRQRVAGGSASHGAHNTHTKRVHAAAAAADVGAHLGVDHQWHPPDDRGAVPRARVLHAGRR
eukprot:4290081-Pyramimonas_sp.AAC.2